jgi:hypothetical protein
VRWVLWAFTHMAPLGISPIAIGVALVCAGLEFWRRVPRTEPAVHEGPDGFRAILNVLNQEDRRDNLR